MTRALSLFIVIGVLSACATPGIHERALTPKSTAAQTAPLPCRAPEHLVRDLTVRWYGAIWSAPVWAPRDLRWRPNTSPRSPVPDSIPPTLRSATNEILCE